MRFTGVAFQRQKRARCAWDAETTRSGGDDWSARAWVGVLNRAGVVTRWCVIAPRVHALPIPGVAAHLINTSSATPSEHVVGFCRIRIGFSYIARPAPDDAMRDPDPVDAFETIDQFHHAGALARAQIQGQVAVYPRDSFQCNGMSFSQIHHVDIVANASPIWCWPVVAKNTERFSLPGGDLADVWH